MFIGFPYTPLPPYPLAKRSIKRGEREVSHYLVKGKEGKEGMGKDYKHRYLMTPPHPGRGCGTVRGL
jgi:hypothetical protein